MYSVCLPLPSNPQLQKQWDFVLSNFPPSELFVVGDEDQAPSTNVFSRLKATYISTTEELPAATVVALCPEHGHYVAGDESLVDFEHPDDVIYLFGADHTHLSSDVLGEHEPDHKVFIPTASKDDMYAHVAYAVTVWDRRMKNG